MSRFTTFLKTTTGMVTAATTLLVAIAGLVTAVQHLGGDNGGSPAAATAETTGSGDAISPPELRSAIPAKVLPTCRPSRQPDHPEETAVAAANCSYREVVKLQYNLFASDVELQQDIANVRKQFGDKHECGSRPLFCFIQDNGEADIVWIDKANLIMGFAWRDDGNLRALYESWKEIAA